MHPQVVKKVPIDVEHAPKLYKNYVVMVWP